MGIILLSASRARVKRQPGHGEPTRLPVQGCCPVAAGPCRYDDPAGGRATAIECDVADFLQPVVGQPDQPSRAGLTPPELPHPARALRADRSAPPDHRTPAVNPPARTAGAQRANSDHPRPRERCHARHPTRPDRRRRRGGARLPLLAAHLIALHSGLRTALLTRLADIGTLRTAKACSCSPSTLRATRPATGADMVTTTIYPGTNLDGAQVRARAAKLRASEVLILPDRDAHQSRHPTRLSPMSRGQKARGDHRCPAPMTNHRTYYLEPELVADLKGLQQPPVGSPTVRVSSTRAQDRRGRACRPRRRSRRAR